MKRPATKIVVAATVLGVAMIAVAGARVAARRAPGGQTNEDMPCGAGFLRRGTRCCPGAVAPDRPASLCAFGPPRAPCPGGLVSTIRGCDAPARSVVEVPATTVTVGPSDWEAEGRVRPRTLHTAPFAIDRFEVSIGGLRCPTCPIAVAARYEDGTDPARAASGVTLAEARAVCKERGGRLPTEDEWIVAAAGDRPRRYPWGDTGAVCRRAAWGLVAGPCGSGATGPDTVGAHADGASPLGIHDLAGNVAEWVEVAPASAVEPAPGGRAAGAEPPREGLGVVRGGSYATDLASELRTWARREVPASAHDPTIGFRCAYPTEGGPALPSSP
jgi:formylglycine-generating enzyme required for sulfatase activity